MLSAGADVLGPGPIPDARRKDVTALIVRAHPVGESLLASLPMLRVIGKHGAGTDNIDMDAAGRRNLQVFRAEGANAESVADLAVLFAMLLLRSPDLHHHALKHGKPARGDIPGGFEMSERRIGILGMGAIGRAVAARLTGGFSANVSGYDPALPQDIWPGSVRRHDDVAALLQETDLLFLHLPLLPQTRNLIGKAELSSLRPGAVIVNCARGGIVDEQALADALASGQIAAAASDVFATEPPQPDNPLLAGSGRFIGTPHIGASTNAGLRGRLVLKGVLDPDDAKLARHHGCDGIIVSNHGGRQLDGALPPIAALPAIRDAVPDMVVMLDSGVRRGTDVLKAVMLGADFVFVGRPFLFAAATDGAAGVRHAMGLLRDEIDRDMALIGIVTPHELRRKTAA